MCRSRSLRRCSTYFIPLVAAACSGYPTQPARPLVGCYHLATVAPTGATAALDALPDSVRLFATRGVSSLEAGQSVVRPWPDTARTSFAGSWWAVVAPDTLTLVFSTGFSGVRIALRPHDTGFAGAAAAFSDGLPAPLATARAWLSPIACGD